VRFVKTGIGSNVIDHNQLLNRGVRTHAEIDNYLGELDDARNGSPDLKSRLQQLSEKVVVFVMPLIEHGGPQDIAIKFPFDGNVISVTALCTTADPEQATEIQIETCSSTSFNSASPTWIGILSTNAVIGSGKSSNDSSPAVIATPVVAAGDYLRTNLVTAGYIDGLTVEVTIQLT
jgi:hypothetical protein